MPKVISKGKLSKETIVSRATKVPKITKSTKPVLAKVPTEDKPKRTRRKKLQAIEGQIVINEVKNRGVLSEGRNNGMAFGFLKKTGDGVFDTVQPLSPCKDYLNEVVTTENTGYGTQGCGLKYPKKNDIYDNGFAYMAIKIMKHKNDITYTYTTSFENDVENLKNNHKNLQFMINDIEDKLGLKTRTQIEMANDGHFLVILPVEWCSSTAAISLYTLLLRVGAYHDGKQDALKYLETFQAHSGDKGYLVSTLPKLRSLIEKKVMPPNTFSTSKTYWESGTACPHGYGIVAWRGTFEEVNPIKEGNTPSYF